MSTVLAVVAFLVGALIVGFTVGSAILTVVVPRATPVMLTRLVFVSLRELFMLRSRRASTYEERDRRMSRYAPVSLLSLAVTWLSLVLVAYMLMFWSLGERPWRLAFALSGSSLLTLGFTPPRNLPMTALSFTEAGIGLALLALLISYLPTIYTAFSRREAAVASLDIRAGRPPSAVAMLERLSIIRGLEDMSDFWNSWEGWFVDIEETHTTTPGLVFYRSPVPQRSWVTAAGTVLDAGSLLASTIEGPRRSEVELCIRAGYLSLRRIADYFGIRYDPDPSPDDPISITREEYDAVRARLSAVDAPLKADADQAWRDFAGWRVNYDTVLLALAGLTMAPYAPWSSDRSLRYRRPPLTRRTTKGARR